MTMPFGILVTTLLPSPNVRVVPPERELLTAFDITNTCGFAAESATVVTIVLDGIVPPVTAKPTTILALAPSIVIVVPLDIAPACVASVNKFCEAGCILLSVKLAALSVTEVFIAIFNHLRISNLSVKAVPPSFSTPYDSSAPYAVVTLPPLDGFCKILGCSSYPPKVPPFDPNAL